MDKPAATVAARLLVVDGEPSVAADVGSALEDLRCDVVAVGSGAEAVEALDGTFDLVLVDRRLPGSGCSEVIRRARHDGVSDVVLLSSDRAADTRREVLRLGADALVHKPIDPESLLGVVAPMLESDRTLDVIPELPRILVVDDDEMVRLSVEASLEEHYDVAVTGSPYEALQYLRTRPFEILITDLMMAEMPGLELIRSARTAQPLLIAIVMTGYASKRAAISSLQEGAYDLLEKPLTPALVRETVAKAWRSLRYRLENRRLLVSLRRTNEELRIARDAAQAANRAKSRFLANMSHELRTPLNGILGSLSLLEATVRFEPGQVDWVRQARESGETLLGLLSTVLDMAGAEAGVLELSQEPFGLAALFEDIGREWRARAPRRELQVDLAEDLPPRAKGDPRRLRQVLDQLLANAHRFTTEGRITVSVRTEETGDDDLLLFVDVADSGPGIPPDELERIFDRFSQVDESSTRRHGGAGLGLAFGRQLARAMGGDLTATSAPGQGSTFHLVARLETLETPPQNVDGGPESGDPAAAATAESQGNGQAPGRAPETPRPGPRPAGPTRRALLVEDEAANRRVITQMLSLLGLEPTAVDNGLRAVEAFEQGEFDVVIMDCQMPEMDGFEAARHIRNLEAEGPGTRIPIIALTGLALEVHRGRCLDAGMDHVLTKPVRLQTLRDLLATTSN